MDELLAEVKLYLRLDGDIEDTLLTGMIKAAKQYLISASGKTKTADGKDIIDDELAKLGIKMLVSHWYDHRGTEWLGSGKTPAEIGYSFKVILAHITSSGDYIC
ncbi:head-tail connector protein [Phascolarctobacterium succinatutens]|uniref:head-tail connector protein n=1 Tax=Phascolarctobacterium succinatutens TaxID=626940 RepID=UPI0030785CCE